MKHQDFIWHLSHGPVAYVTDPRLPSADLIADRIKYVKLAKPPAEHAKRLRLMHEVKDVPSFTYALYVWAVNRNVVPMQILHQAECPNCDYNWATMELPLP